MEWEKGRVGRCHQTSFAHQTAQMTNFVVFFLSIWMGRCFFERGKDIHICLQFLVLLTKMNNSTQFTYMWEQQGKTANTIYNHHGRKYPEERNTTTLNYLESSLQWCAQKNCLFFNIVPMKFKLLRNISCISIQYTFKI